MSIKNFFQNVKLSRKPHNGMKTYLLEGDNPDQPVKSLYESQVHPSVFEENLGADHPHPHYDKAVFSWIAPEFKVHDKNSQWWTIASIFWLIAMIIEAIMLIWSMLAATLTLGLVYWYLHVHHPPKYLKINISELGFKIGHETFSFKQIEAFWIIETSLGNRLYLRLKNRFQPDQIIELEQQNPEAIRSFLDKRIKEDVGIKEKFSDLILRILKI